MVNNYITFKIAYFIHLFTIFLILDNKELLKKVREDAIVYSGERATRIAKEKLETIENNKKQALKEQMKVITNVKKQVID